MKELKIECSNLIALVDDEDFERLKLYKWYYTPTTIRRYKVEDKLKITFSLAEEVTTLYGKMIDHIDKNPFNNQKFNLREVSYSENNHNRTKVKGTTSRHRGVFWYTLKNRWRSVIYKDKKAYVVGLFDDEDTAAIAYNIKAKELYGDKANLNLL